MGLLINGDVYIKIRPDIKIDEEKIQEKEQQLDEIKFEEAHNGITDETQQMRTIVEKELEILYIGKLVYDYTDNFHVLKITENGIKMYNYDRTGKAKKNKCDIEELQEKYVRLIDFLKEAEYIGKEFIRTVPLLTENGIDTSYWNQNPYESTLILYKTDYAMLAYYKNEHSKCLEMIKPEYFKDNKYTFIGNQNRMYENNDKIYRKVIDEIEHRYQYYKKYK